MNTGANLFMIKSPNGEFYNGQTQTWEKRMYLGTYALSKNKAEEVLLFYELDAQVIQVTELEFTESLASQTTKLTIMLDATRSELEAIRFRLPTISNLNRNLGNFLKNTSQKLKDLNPHFRDFEKQKEDQTFEVLGFYENFISEVSKTELYYCHEVAEILKAYHKDRSSILGITRKINKH